MMPTIESLGLTTLPIDQQICLVEDWWDFILANPNRGSLLTDEQRAELDRRLADHDANPHDVVTLEEFKAEAMRRLAS